MPTLRRLNATPVKSTALVHPPRGRLAEDGLEGNRLFFLVDSVGFLFTAAEAPALLRVRSSFDAAADRLGLELPDGSRVEDDAGVLGDALTTDFYGRPVPGHVVEGPFAAALGDLVRRPVRLVRCDRPGDAVDVEPLTLVSTASVRELGERGGRDGDLDARRFRMTLEIPGCEPYEEDTWAERELRVGEALLRVGEQVPRCVVTTLDPDTGEKDFPTLTVIARTRTRIGGRGGLPFGMYATVERPGDVAVGDRVELA